MCNSREASSIGRPGECEGGGRECWVSLRSYSGLGSGVYEVLMSAIDNVATEPRFYTHPKDEGTIRII